jgi:hypothetical protein
LRLAQAPFDADKLPTIVIPPPSIRVRSKDGEETTLEAPLVVSDSSLKKRTRERADHIRQHGFLQQRPINPLLACPQRFGKQRAKRMKADLEYLWQRQGINFQFDFFLYSDVEQIRKKIDQGGYDALFAVLPEGWRVPHRSDDTHEKIKQRIEVPSQCIQHDHTLPEAWVDKPPREFRGAEPKLAKRIRERYEICLGNLLVKHHWIPFAPAEAFYYNTHVGLDVGGRHNNRAMVCLGYGFQRPRDGLVFRLEEIPIDVQQAEPIPTDCLYRGLLRLFEFVRSELTSAGWNPDFERILFPRDGLLLGNGDEWNERDALVQLHTEFLNRGWVTQDSIWTAVEILKSAEGWRLLRSQGEVMNPLVGKCLFPFDDETVALLCTTGAPYLSQGTACPLMIRIVDIYDRAKRAEVIRDLIWQADMCFTKFDTGMRLPWVLHVADTGALQLSRSYKITGVTV